jgi:hypothetical protein
LTDVVWAGDGLLTFGGSNGRHLNAPYFFILKQTLNP